MFKISNGWFHITSAPLVDTFICLWSPRIPEQKSGFPKFRSRLREAVIRVYDEAGNVIETHEHAGGFKEW